MATLSTIDSPDLPPSVQVLLKNLQQDTFLKGNLILVLGGVSRHSNVYLLCACVGGGDVCELGMYERNGVLGLVHVIV